MFIRNLELKTFRNYQILNIDNIKNVNFFIGTNGSGKTNILESISYISHLKSFRNVSEKDIIKWDNDCFYISMTDDKKNKYEVGCHIEDGKLKKKIKINGDIVNRLSLFYSKVMTVFFCPDDAHIINGNPDPRRRYFDSVIAKADNDYIKTLSDFKKILSSRNFILKEIRIGKKKEKELDIWDSLFAEKAEKIILSRESFNSVFSDLFRESYRKISDKNDIPSIKYSPNMDVFDKDKILSTLHNNRQKDIVIGTSHCGPHRDDFVIEMNEKNMKFCGSQGQIRTAAISLKNAEKYFIEKETGDKSILIVDDVFSELDAKRKSNLVSELSSGNQVFFSMVKIDESVISNYNDLIVYNVEDGKVNSLQ